MAGLVSATLFLYLTMFIFVQYLANVLKACRNVTNLPIVCACGKVLVGQLMRIFHDKFCERPSLLSAKAWCRKEREEALDESKVRMKLARGEWRRRGVEKEINEEHPVLAFP